MGRRRGLIEEGSQRVEGGVSERSFGRGFREEEESQSGAEV